MCHFSHISVKAKVYGALGALKNLGQHSARGLIKLISRKADYFDSLPIASVATGVGMKPISATMALAASEEVAHLRNLAASPVGWPTV